MTSRKLYWAKCLENVKRRSWTWVFTMAALFLYFPLANLISLANNSRRISNMIVNGVDPVTIENNRSSMSNDFAYMTGFSEIFVVVMAFFAVLFAVQGFSYLYSRQKMDLYMSVPVSVPKRFVLIWANGILCFGAAYLLNLLLAFFAGAVYRVVDLPMLVFSLLAFLVNMLAFAALYQLAMIGVMLTGNVLTALLGCGVLFFYEVIARTLYSWLKSGFFMSYCWAEDQALFALPWMTPTASFFDFCAGIWYREGRLYGADGTPGNLAGQLLFCVIVLALQLLVTGGIAYFLYRRRKTESYQTAIAFHVIKPVLELLLVLPFSILIGMFLADQAGGGDAFLFAGTIGAALLGHAVIQIIFEKELKAMLRRRVLAAAATAVSLCVLSFFRYDWAGYDSYLPARQEVAAVSVTLENDSARFGNYPIPFFSYRGESMEERLLEQMNSTEPKTIEAVLSMVEKWQREGIPALKQEEQARMVGGIMVNGQQTASEYDDARIFNVRYTLTDGKTVTRRFYAGETLCQEELKTVTLDPAYQKLRYQVYEEAFVQSLGQMEISYYDGVQNLLYTGDKDRLLEAVRSDFESYGFETIQKGMPVGALQFVLTNPADSGDKIDWEYPVYASFARTVDILAENGMSKAGTEQFLNQEDVASITIYYYHEDGLENGLVADGLAESQQVTVAFDEPAQIEALLAGLYPEYLAELAGNEFITVGRDSRFGVEITLSKEALDKRYQANNVFFLEGQVPDFVEKKVAEAIEYH